MRAPMVLVLSLVLGGLVSGQDWTEGLVVSNKVRVRAEPSTDAKVIVQASVGQVYPIRGQGEGGESLVDGLPKSYWYQVETPQGAGYIWGGFFWPANAKPTFEYPSNPVTLVLGKNASDLRLAFWSDNPDQGHDMPEYDEHNLVGFRTDQGQIWLIHGTKQVMASTKRLETSSDGFLVLTSGMGGSQSIDSLSLKTGVLTLEISEQTNGGMVYRTRLVAKLVAKAPAGIGLFEVTSVKEVR